MESQTRSLSSADHRPFPNDIPVRGDIGVVVIGRNEGTRLAVSLGSVANSGVVVIYVDSGSTDMSMQVATDLRVQAHALDPVRPFTAARARNEGWQLLHEQHPSIELVQFVDGDCELDSHWLNAAAAFLAEHAKVAAVCGRLRERYPHHSIYNELCDMEWNTPVGAARACGGIAMFRMAALAGSGGFREDLLAGEEPELCLRLRSAGWDIWRIDSEMGLHDAAMARFTQWWRRAMRGGYGYAQGRALHGASTERHFVRQSRSALAWGVLLPLSIAVLAFAFSSPLPLALLSFYPLKAARIYSRIDGSSRERRLRAAFVMLAKFPEGVGQLKFLTQRLFRRKGKLIEYK